LIGHWHARHNHLVGENAIGFEDELDKPGRHRRFRGAVRLEAARLAGHTRDIELSTALGDGVVGLAEAAGAEPDETVEDGFAKELDCVAGEEERDVVPLFGGAASDEEAERRPRRRLRAVRDLDQELGHTEMVAPRACRYLVEILAETRIQLCGRLVVRIEGRRIENELPGRQGRVAFAYLATHRQRPVTREELIDALWGSARGSDRLSPLLSKLRGVAPIEGRGDVRLALPEGAWVDLEAAAESLHRAESAVARGDWSAAWSPGRVAQHISARDFLPGEEGGWIEEQRRRLEQIHDHSLELVGNACLRIGGSELATAERAARSAAARSPYSESAHLLLMEVLAAQGNPAEALLVYEGLRVRLREELGAAPSDATQALHRRLLG
jgi:DNA-binding SARP family transcriptional activator